MNDMINIAIITQNDLYALPRNVKLLCDSENINISELIIVNAAGSLENKKWLFVSGFGFQQTAKMVITTLRIKLRSYFASAFRFLGKSNI